MPDPSWTTIFLFSFFSFLLKLSSGVLLFSLCVATKIAVGLSSFIIYYIFTSISF